MIFSKINALFRELLYKTWGSSLFYILLDDQHLPVITGSIKILKS